MASRLRSLVLIGAFAAGLAGGAAQAATPEEGAGEAAREWAKAVMTGDVSVQLKLRPKLLFVKPGEREREERRLMHDKELAVINGEKYLSFEVQPKATVTGKVGNQLVLMFPYRSVLQTRDAKLQRESTVIALAEEGSSDWYVIDGTGQNLKSMKLFLPGYAGSPRVPQSLTKALPLE